MSYFRRLGAALVGRDATRTPPRTSGRGFGAFNAAEKASAVGRLIASTMLGQPVWPRRDYEQLAREGYQQNPVVARAVDLIATGVASITFELHRGRGKSAKVYDDHPLLDLLRNPNPGQDGQALMQALVSHMVISGNGYLERTGEDRIERMELFALRPDRMRVVPGPHGYAQGYEYTAGGRTHRYDVDAERGRLPVLHLKRFHPTDDFYGMSALDPAAWSIDTHTAAAAHNKALLENGATPTGALVYTGNPDNGNRMSDDQFARLRQELDEQITAIDQRGRPLLLEGGLDWRQFGLDLDGLQFVEAKNLAAREIAFALGVPPMLLGIPGDNTYSNYVEANRAFYRSTVIPHAQWIARALTQWFAPLLERDMRLVVDMDSIEALAVERKELWDKLERSTFLSFNEKREALGYQPVTGGDEVYVNAGLLPLGDPDAATIRGGPEPEPPDDEEPDREDLDPKKTVTPFRRRIH
jgi:HK97 family phage portal protein